MTKWIPMGLVGAVGAFSGFAPSAALAQTTAAPPPLPAPAPAPAPAPTTTWSTQQTTTETTTTAGVPPEYRPSERPERERTAFNGLYLEILGSGGLYSLNYDRLLSEHVSVRVGFSYFSLSAANSSGSGSVSLLTVPLTVAYLVGGANHKLELGGGVTPAYASAVSTGSFSKDFTGSTAGVGVFGTLVVGYRYAPMDGGFLFRIGFTPLIGAGGFLPWGGMSLGAVF